MLKISRSDKKFKCFFFCFFMGSFYDIELQSRRYFILPMNFMDTLYSKMAAWWCNIRNALSARSLHTASHTHWYGEFGNHLTKLFVHFVTFACYSCFAHRFHAVFCHVAASGFSPHFSAALFCCALFLAALGVPRSLAACASPACLRGGGKNRLRSP